MEFDQTIKELLEAVGGKENIANYEHCATRLRIILKDDKKLDKEKAEKVSESKGYFFNTGQHQFIFGTGRVNRVYQEFSQKVGAEGKDANFKDDVYQNLSTTQKIIRTFADILVPLIPALVTTGLLMGVRSLLVELGMEMDENWFAIFEMLTDTAFAFLPVLIAFSATRKFGGTPILGITVGLMMVAPQIPNAWAVAEGTEKALTIFGLEIVGYQGSIFPAILAGWMISKLEHWFRKFVPEMMDLVVTPFLTITITLAVILFALGPILQTTESFVMDSIVKLVEAPLGIGYIIFGGIQQLVVITGLHHSMGVVELGVLSSTGENVFQPLATASMTGQFGAAIATATLFKNKVKRTNAISAAMPTLFGITEPLLFGVNIRAIRVFISGVIGGAVGGFMIYLFSLAAPSLGVTFIPGLLLYTGNLGAMGQYCIVMIVSFVVGFGVVQLQRKAISTEINAA
ncbi:PTS sugar transporter subunit IIA [Tetragenococcus halophilus]|uniref:PTS sugar transporter subunit IIA n=1 Tax=Tetragenococcus halophilus TaxID=51669 RepID=A0A3G5FIH4_TETHA|nr:PTS transporter subunit EIIC [Tetragenococcus halophilus]AYW50157.1 PTS sugar transporter subunit IIA [Tetragenococcus halophilus]GBD64582.1 Pts system sucrose-specific eiibc component [Tetragenococcus halophilus subsp. flandriensis]